MTHTESDDSSARTGAIFALLCYGTWGLVPLYWHMLARVPAHEILAHRIVWSSVLLVGLLAWKRQVGALGRALVSRRALLLACTSAVLIAVNWGIYIFAVTHDRVLESSLGYFINPLVNVALGVLFLKESLTRAQTFALLLTLVGVANLVLRANTFPWIALSLSLTFGFYGLVRKVTPLPSLVGSSLESLVLTPIAAGFLLWLGARGQGHFSVAADGREALLLILGGAVTALPLLWFSEAAKRLRLIILGFFQFLSPSLQFLIAVVVFHEPFTSVHAWSFACIWLALAVNVTAALRQHRANR